MHGDAYPGPGAECREVVGQGLASVRALGLVQPPLRAEDERVGEDVRVGVHVVRVHADGGAGRDHPLSVLQSVEAVDARAALHRSEAQTQACVLLVRSHSSGGLGARRRLTFVDDGRQVGQLLQLDPRGNAGGVGHRVGQLGLEAGVYGRLLERVEYAQHHGRLDRFHARAGQGKGLLRQPIEGELVGQQVGGEDVVEDGGVVGAARLFGVEGALVHGREYLADLLVDAGSKVQNRLDQRQQRCHYVDGKPVDPRLQESKVHIPVADPERVGRDAHERRLEVGGFCAVGAATEAQFRDDVDGEAREHVAEVEDAVAAGIFGGNAVGDALDELVDSVLGLAQALPGEEAGHRLSSRAVQLAAWRAEDGIGHAEAVPQLFLLVYRPRRAVVAVHFVPVLGVVDVQLVRRDAHNGPVFVVHSLDLP